MSNRFDIEVTALDRFAKVFARFNRSVDSTARPLANVERRSNAAFSVKPIANAVKGLGVLGASVDKVAGSLGGLSGPAQAFLGIGAAGGVVGIGAAVLTFTTRYADMGTQVLRTSQRLAVSTDEMQLWAAAAKGAGFQADSVADNMARVGDALQGARYGRRKDVTEALASLGLDLRVKNGIVDVTGTLMDLARVLERVRDPYTRATIANVFGIDPDLTQFLSSGVAALTARIEDARRKGSAQSAEALQQAEAQKQAIGELGNAWDRLANKMGAAMSPPVTRLLNSATGAGPRAPTVTVGRGGDLWSELMRGPSIWAGQDGAGGAGVTSTLSRDQGKPSGAAGADDDRPPELRGHASAAARLAADLAEARQELARTRAPADRAAIQSEIDRMVRVEVSFANAPPGTTARATSGGAPVPVRVGNAMPSGSLP